MYQFPHHPFGIMPPLSSWNASLSLLSSGTPLTKGIKNHPQKNKNHQITQSYLHPDHFFSVVSHHHQTDNTTTTKRKRKKREREKKTNKKTPKENQAKELQQQHNICVVLCFWVFFAWYRVAVDKE
jgi:hypothetical protein